MVNAWNNADGLYITYGTTEGTVGKAGEYRTNGPQHITEVTITLTDATATDGGTIYDNNVMLPAGAQIQQVVVINEVAATGTGAVLNLGLIRTDRTTELDYNGLLAALPLTSFDTIGETTTLTVGSTYAGALIGTVLANNGLLTIDYDTAAFTTGKIVAKIYWSVRT